METHCQYKMTINQCLPPTTNIAIATNLQHPACVYVCMFNDLCGYLIWLNGWITNYMSKLFTISLLVRIHHTYIFTTTNSHTNDRSHNVIPDQRPQLLAVLCSSYSKAHALLTTIMWVWLVLVDYAICKWHKTANRLLLTVVFV